MTVAAHDLRTPRPARALTPPLSALYLLCVSPLSASFIAPLLIRHAPPRASLPCRISLSPCSVHFHPLLHPRPTLFVGVDINITVLPSFRAHPPCCASCPFDVHRPFAPASDAVCVYTTLQSTSTRENIDAYKQQRCSTVIWWRSLYSRFV
ncbi:hypothetical protein C8R44DRAFT_796710 [Mycena epipterygia]|nr:hypothetical protein C8R44DRAFT_826694 [Mycena epipterygia]KAJ7113539.1 hypothetical protein C8R44DRAFT_796710 [Mycena epipterygia]